MLDVFVNKKNDMWFLRHLDMVSRNSYYSKTRIVKTSFQENITERDLMLLKRLRLDCLVVIYGKRMLNGITAIMRTPPGSEEQVRYIDLSNFDDRCNFYQLIEAYEEELSRFRERSNVCNQGRGAIVVGCGDESQEDIRYYLDELESLLNTLGISTIDSLWQKRPPDPSFLIGRGKLAELRELCEIYDCDMIVFFNTLTPLQKKNIEDETGVQIFDRNQIILDIFAKRARSNEGKIQVEYAYLKYQLPRLSEKDSGLSRLVGGFKTKGPGETKLEIMKRRLKDRIAFLNKRIADIRRRRDFLRERRRSSNLPLIAIVGYTNAGKSTLLNRITKSNVYVEDKLFATLDPSTRRYTYSDGLTVLFSDTVGFIKNLPEELKNAFMATFEEINDADLILNVADISSPDVDRHIEAVEEILMELGVDHIPRVLVLNKVDRVRDAINLKRSDGVYISAITGDGIDTLLGKIRGYFS